MIRLARFLAAPAAALFFSGCVSMIPSGIVGPDGQVARPDRSSIPRSSGEPQLKFSLVLGTHQTAAANMAQLLTTHSPLRNVRPDDPNADVVLNWEWATEATGVKIDAVSAYTGKTLLKLQDRWWTQAEAGTSLGHMIYGSFIPGGELYKQVVAERAAHRPASGVAAAPAAVSAEQVAQIVAQTLKAQSAPAAAPRAPEGAETEAPRYSLPADPKKFAVIVGVEQYADLPPATYAERDAAAVKKHAVALGFPERNILSLTGVRATKSGLVKSLETWLARNVQADSTVMFYFSGHGAPDPATGRAYLMPSDGDPQFLEETAYPTSRLYEVLGKLKAKRKLVVMDACFSGAGGRSVLAKGTRPLVNSVDLGRPSGGVVALAAAGPNQITGADEDARHGLFTHFLLRGLNGAARDGSGRVTARALLEYAAPNVQDAARRQNRDQKPVLVADGGADFSLR